MGLIGYDSSASSLGSGEMCVIIDVDWCSNVDVELNMLRI